MSAYGPNAKCRNVRYCAAVGVIADMTQTPFEADVDPERSFGVVGKLKDRGIRNSASRR